ncbi:hypothetical protein TNCV_666911 [Trichonephila clavipes]|nr:hypothetical protein TNCV_666911 [Trichonephila clavipes]
MGRGNFDFRCVSCETFITGLLVPVGRLRPRPEFSSPLPAVSKHLLYIGLSSWGSAASSRTRLANELLVGMIGSTTVFDPASSFSQGFAIFHFLLLLLFLSFEPWDFPKISVARRIGDSAGLLRVVAHDRVRPVRLCVVAALSRAREENSQLTHSSCKLQLQWWLLLYQGC